MNPASHIAVVRSMGLPDWSTRRNASVATHSAAALLPPLQGIAIWDVQAIPVKHAEALTG